MWTSKAPESLTQLYISNDTDMSATSTDALQLD